MNFTPCKHFAFNDGKTRCGRKWHLYAEILLDAIDDWQLVTCKACLRLKA